MTKRTYGEGTEVKLGADGRWHAYVSLGVKSGGRRDRRHLSGATQQDVRRQVREALKQRDDGLRPADGRSMTLAVWLDHWLDTIAAPKLRPSTLTGYRQYIENRIKPALGHYRLKELQPEHVERFYRAAAQPGRRVDSTGKTVELRPLAPASILQCHRVLSRALKVAMQRGRVAQNVCMLVDAPSVRRQEVEPLTADEARRVLETASGHRNAARWSVALALGLRQGEALGLQWSDLDLDSGSVRVRRALQRQPHRHGCDGTCEKRRAVDCPTRIDGGLVFVEPKSLAGTRTIALPGPLIESLRAHRKAQVTERIAAGDEWRDLDLVFAQVNGRPIDPRADWKAWGALLGEAQVRRARLHDARHTAATLLLQQGVHARVAMQILGHSQISLTLGTYSHVVPDLARDAADKMGTVLWGIGT
jgi:integrase